MSPGSVNFTALETRLTRIWRTLPSSPRMSGGRAPSWVWIASDLAAASGSSEVTTSSISPRGAKSASTRVILPASILERSSTSLIKASRLRALRSTRSSALVCLGLTAPSVPLPTSSVKPRIAFIGVRSSWLMLARNSLLRRLAARACS